LHRSDQRSLVLPEYELGPLAAFEPPDGEVALRDALKMLT